MRLNYMKFVTWTKTFFIELYLRFDFPIGHLTQICYNHNIFVKAIPLSTWPENLFFRDFLSIGYV